MYVYFRIKPSITTSYIGFATQQDTSNPKNNQEHLKTPHSKENTQKCPISVPGITNGPK